MEYTSMGARGKYSSENNLWSRPWSASQPSSRRGSEQSVKDGSNVPRTGVVSEDNNNNTDVTKIGASIESLRRDGELSMGAPPPLTAAFSGSVSNFTHQNAPNVNLVHRRGSRRSVAEAPPGLSVDRTADINGDEGQSASAARSSGNLSQGSTLGSALGSRSLHKQKSGEVHVSVPPGLSSINDVSSSAEELASNTNVAPKGSTNKMNQNSGNASSLPPKFSLKQSKNDVHRSTPPGFSSQQDMTASIDDTPANSTSNLQTPQQQGGGGGGVGGKTKSPYASRSSVQKSTEAVRSRNELKPPPGLSYPQNSASTNGASSSPQHDEKKTKSPYASRASFKTSTDADVSNQQSRNELRPPPGLSSTQGSSAKIDENQNKSGSATENVQKGSGKSKSARGSKASIHKGSASQVNADEQGREYTSAHSTADDSPSHVGYDHSQPSRKDGDVRGDEKTRLGASKSMNLGPFDSVASVAPGPSKSAFDLRSEDPVDKNSKKGASNSLLSKHERRVRIEDPPVTSFSEHEGSATLGPKKEVARASSSGLSNKSVGELAANDSSAYTWLSDRVREPRGEQQKEVKTYSPKEVRTSFASLEPRKTDADLGTKEKETHEKASGASYNLLTGNSGTSTTKSFSPKEVQTSFASLAPLPRTDLGAKETHEKASGASYNLLSGSSGTKSFSPKEVQTSFASVAPYKDHRIKETQEKANDTSYNQLAGNDREPRIEEATSSSKFQSSGDLNAGTKLEPVKPNESVSYSAAPSAFVASVLASIRAQNKAAEFQKDVAKSTEPLAFDKVDKVYDKPTTVASNLSLGSRNVASDFASRTAVPRQSENDMHRFSSNPSTTTSAAKLNDRFGVDDHVKNSRTNNTLASENSLYSGPSLTTSQRSIASSVVDRRTDRDDADSHRLGKTVSIGGINSVGNSASNLVGGSRGSVRVDNSQVSIDSVGNSANNLVGGSRSSVRDGSEFSLSASERGSTNSLRKRYGSEESKTETRKEDTGKSVEPAFERSYAFALKWDPYTLRVKCEHKGEIRLAYLPIRKILDEPDDSCMIIDTFQKLFSDSIHNPDIFDPSRHFLAFLDADGDWCTLGDTPEDYKVFVESSKFDPTKAASRVARLKSFDLSILEDLSRRESTDSVEEEVDEDDSTKVKTSRRPSQGSIKSTTSIGERSGGRKLMHGNSEDLQEIQRKDSFASSVLSIFSSTGFAFPDEAFSIQQAVSLGWLCGAAPMAVAVRHSEFWKTSGFQTEEYHREEYWYDYTIFALGVSMLLSFIGFARAVTVDKQRLGLALLCVNAISFCSYLSIVAGLTPAISDIVNRPLEIVRYMDWAFTCPMLILLMGQLTQTERKIGRAMIVNVVMITTRFFGSCLPWSYGLPFSAASFACFSFLISDMWCWWSAAVAREKANVNDQEKTRGSIGVETLVILQILTTASSVMYPIIWLLGISDVVSFEEGEILYCVADVLAKVVFTMIAVSNCFEKSRPLRLELDSDITIAKNLTEKINASTSSLNSVGRTLQREPSVDMDTFEAATVVSCDIIGYTAMVDRFTPNSSSKTLHNLWKHFESIARVYRIYKVESKGGTFMGVAGAPDPSNNHAEQAAEFALDVLQMVKVFTTEQNKNGQHEKIRIRIGLHTGPLSAGIVDRKSFRYGIFGDTVTTAGHLEATCDPMRIHVSEEVYKALEGKGFEFEECDAMEGNGKGRQQTYFLVGKRMD